MGWPSAAFAPQHDFAFIDGRWCTQAIGRLGLFRSKRTLTFVVMTSGSDDGGPTADKTEGPVVAVFRSGKFVPERGTGRTSILPAEGRPSAVPAEGRASAVPAEGRASAVPAEGRMSVMSSPAV